jgi:hypothetical protein
VKTVILRALEADDKAAALRSAIRSQIWTQGCQRFEVDPAGFREVPRSPFAYWVSERVRHLFRELPPFDSAERTATVGLQSSDDLRFLRLWWEHRGASGFVTFAKGGQFSPYYADVFLAVQWGDNGNEIKAFAATTPGSTHWSRNIRSADHYFRPGLTWPRRTQGGLSLRAMPTGCVFADKGPAAFADGDDKDDLLALLAMTNTRIFRVLVDMQMAFGSYEVGVIQRTPVPHLEPSDRAELAALAQHAWSLKRSIDTPTETSHAFTLPALLLAGGGTLGARARAWAGKVRASEAELAAIQAEIDAVCFRLYKVDAADRWAIAEWSGVSGDIEGENDSGGADDSSEAVELDPARLAAWLVSWAVGVAVGRFDLRLATGERSRAEEPNPFDPLRVCSPGMLTGADGLPLVTTPPEYGVEVSPVLVDDPGHRLDITVRVRSVFDAVFGGEADQWWGEVGVALGAKGGEVGGWLGRGFFDHHVKTYSKSRRKAPILWPIGTKTGSYVVWLYAPQASSDSLFQILNDLVVPKLGVEDRELTQLRLDAGTDPTASQRRAIDTQERFVGELREFREELEAVAPLWAPDLNDGTVIVLAPLWRLFSHHRAWSSELKKHWAKLTSGDYDWAKLAMHLWPERVVAKCAEDRSLAIAHGLEDVFWVEDQAIEDKWLPRQIPAPPIDQLIAQRHSPATTAALQWKNT